MSGRRPGTVAASERGTERPRCPLLPAQPSVKLSQPADEVPPETRFSSTSSTRTWMSTQSLAAGPGTEVEPT
jgi:hypothetical protein